jgi:hypothetical protein
MPAQSDDHYDWGIGSVARAAASSKGSNSNLYGEISPAKDDDDGYLDSAPAKAAPKNAYLDTAPVLTARGKDSTAGGNTAITIGARCTVKKLSNGTVRFVGPIGIKVRSMFVQPDCQFHLTLLSL